VHGSPFRAHYKGGASLFNVAEKPVKVLEDWKGKRVTSAFEGELPMTLTEKEIRTKLREPVGKPVKYKYPGGHQLRGSLKDRVIV
jgi:hypothetical protein